jgi:hypothetical protein
MRPQRKESGGGEGDQRVRREEWGRRPDRKEIRGREGDQIERFPSHPEVGVLVGF